MLGKEEVLEKLVSLGASVDEAKRAYADVIGVVAAKVAKTFIREMPETTRAALKNTPPDSMQEFLAAKHSELPEISIAYFEKIHDETWRNYFESVGSNS